MTIVLRSKVGIAIIAAVLGAGVASGVSLALAQATTNSNVYYACMRTVTGQIRSSTIRLDVAPNCRSSETVTSWNAEGPQGDTGPQGPSGTVAPCSGFPHNDVDWSIPGSAPGHGCDLHGAFMRAHLSRANLTNINFEDAFLHDSVMVDAVLTGANLRIADLTDVDLSGASLLNADLSGADVRGAQLGGIDLTDANLTNANLRGAHGTPGSTAGMTWDNTTCPDNSNSDAHGNTCDGHFVEA